MENFVPDIYKESIYTIDYKKLKQSGIKCLLFDLDNTLVSYRDKLPTKKVKDLFTKLKKMGFKVIIFSNSGSKRLKPFKEQLDVDVCSRCFKPSPNKFLYVINEYKLEVSQIAIIGDQFYTDIIGGNRVGIVGSAVVDNGQVININYISSLNIRIAREIKGAANEIIDNIFENISFTSFLFTITTSTNIVCITIYVTCFFN